MDLQAELQDKDKIITSEKCSKVNLKNEIESLRAEQHESKLVKVQLKSLTEELNFLKLYH